MRSIVVTSLVLVSLVVPADAQEAAPAPKVVSSDACLFGIPADAHAVAAARSVTIVKCRLTAPLIPDASVNAALGQNTATKAATNGLNAGNILATTASGSSVTIYVNAD